MTSRRMTALVAAGVLAASGLAGCGDDETDDSAAPPAATEPAQTDNRGAETQPAGETVEVAADPGGSLAYVQSSLRASAGTVTFEFTNDANIPHDFNIERDGEHIAGTEVITGSQETLTVELEPGRYVFYCSVDQHREAGMEGPLVVE